MYPSSYDHYLLSAMIFEDLIFNNLDPSTRSSSDYAQSEKNISEHLVRKTLKESRTSFKFDQAARVKGLDCVD